MLSPEFAIPENDTRVTPYVLQVHSMYDRPHVWRTYQGLWDCNDATDAIAQAQVFRDKCDDPSLYDGWRVIQVLAYTPEVDS